MLGHTHALTVRCSYTRMVTVPQPATPPTPPGPRSAGMYARRCRLRAFPLRLPTVDQHGLSQHGLGQHGLGQHGLGQYVRIQNCLNQHRLAAYQFEPSLQSYALRGIPPSASELTRRIGYQHTQPRDRTMTVTTRCLKAASSASRRGQYCERPRLPEEAIQLRMAIRLRMVVHLRMAIHLIHDGLTGDHLTGEDLAAEELTGEL